MYAVTLASPPASYGTNHWHVFLVSHDGGSSWVELRIDHERILPGTQPCGYEVWSLQPHDFDPRRVLTIEGCTGRGMAPVGGQSLAEGIDESPFPGSLPTRAIVGGRGVDPGRWYALLRFDGSRYGGSDHSRLARSDDDGATWVTLLESDTGGVTPERAKPADLFDRLAYNPGHADELYAVISHLEAPAAGPYAISNHRLTKVSVRASQDGGVTWVDLGTPNVSAGALPSIFDLAVGIDGRYLFAATDEGLYRLALTH